MNYKPKIAGMQGNHFMQDSTPSPELEHKAKKVSEKFSESLHTIANEPSLAFYRVQEHVRKSLPQLVERKVEVQDLQQQVQGACFDMDYAVKAVRGVENSGSSFQKIQELLKNSMFVKQQLHYEKSRKEQERSRPSMYRNSMVRTQTVDIPSDMHRNLAEMTQSNQLPSSLRTAIEESPTRGRSSSLSSHTPRPPPSLFR